MNCKPGDLAIIVRSLAGNEGKIVRCLEGVWSIETMPWGDRASFMWRTDTVLKSWSGSFDCWIADRQLRPIRDPGDDAKDEMLRPLPHEVTA